MNRIKRVIIALALFISVPVIAQDEISISFGAQSVHFGDRVVEIVDPSCDYGPCPTVEANYKYNNKHNFLAVSYNSFVIGKFKNSFYNDSKFIAYDFKVYQTKTSEIDHKFSLITGLVTGYKKHQLETALNDNIGVYFAPTWKSEYKINNRFSLSANLSLLGTKSAVLTTSINYQL